MAKTKVKDATTGTVNFVMSVSNLEVAYLLSCAFESGDVGYWCRLGKVKGLTKKAEKAVGDLVKRVSAACWLPLVEGCGVEVIEHNDSRDPKDWAKPVLLDRAAIVRGLALMAKGNPYQFGQFIAGKADMTTGDVFLQFCVLGEEKYG